MIDSRSDRVTFALKPSSENGSLRHGTRNEPHLANRERTVTLRAFLFAAFSSPCLAQDCHSDPGGNQNQPPLTSPTIAAVPLEASAAVNKHIRAACSSWSVSHVIRCQTASGSSKFFDSSDSNLPVGPFGRTAVVIPCSFRLRCRLHFDFRHKLAPERRLEMLPQWVGSKPSLSAKPKGFF